jgi:hypothetical protein
MKITKREAMAFVAALFISIGMFLDHVLPSVFVIIAKAF